MKTQTKIDHTIPAGNKGDFFRNYGALIGIIGLLVIFGIIDHRFLRPANIWGVFKNSAFLILIQLKERS